MIKFVNDLVSKHNDKKPSIPALLYLGIFLAPFIVNPWEGMNPYETGKVSFVVGFMGLSILVLMYLAIKKRQVDIPYSKAVFMMLGLWVTSYVISQIFSIAPIQSAWGTFDRLQGSIIHLYYLMHFLICLWVLRNPVMQRRFFWLIFFVGAALAIHATGQFVVGEGVAMDATPNSFGDRVYATLGNPNVLGQLLIFPIFAGIAVFPKKMKYRLLVAAGFCAMMVALYLTHNRATWIGLLGAGLVAVLFWLRNGHKKAAVIVIGILMIATSALLFTNLRVRFLDVRSLGTRGVLWSSAVSSFADHPIFGSGLETINERLTPHLSPKLYQYENLGLTPDRSHNELLDILLTRGLAGGLLYAALFIGLFGIMFHKKQPERTWSLAVAMSLVAYGISTQFGFSTITHVIVLLGFVAVFLNQTLIFSVLKISVKTYAGIALIFLGLAASSATIYLAHNVISTDIQFAEATSSVIAEGHDVGAQKFQNLFAINNYFLSPYNAAFIFLHEYSPRVLEISPQNVRARAMYGEFLFQNHQMKEGGEYFAELMEQNPAWPFGWYIWGKYAFEAGNSAQAIFAMEHLKDLAPPVWKYGSDLEKRSDYEKQQFELFQQANHFFFDGIGMLGASYQLSGDYEKAAAIEGGPDARFTRSGPKF